MHAAINLKSALARTVLWAGIAAALVPHVAAVAQAPPSPEKLVLDGKIEQAVRLAARTPDGAESTLRELTAIADDQITTRRIAEAQATLQAAERFRELFVKTHKGRSVPGDALKGRLLRLEGIQLSDRKEYAKAEATLRKALETSSRTGDGVLIAGIHNNLGYSLRHQEKLDEAAQEFDLARKQAEAQKDDLRAGSYNFNLGEVLHQLGKVQQATEAYKRSAEQNHAAGRTSLEARAILMQGATLSKVNAVSPEPLKLFAQALKMFEQLGDHRNQGWAYYLMGDHTAYSMQFPEAAALVEKAVPPLTKAGDDEGLYACYQFLSDMYVRLGNNERAERFRKLALEIANKK